MEHQVVTAVFRTRSHARWSVVFEQLGIGHQYQPWTFRSRPGSCFTPAFWLPEQRLWFDAVSAEPSVPVDWRGFAHAADPRRNPGTDTSFEVAEGWRGQSLLAIGRFHPDVVRAGPERFWIPRDSFDAFELRSWPEPRGGAEEGAASIGGQARLWQAYRQACLESLTTVDAGVVREFLVLGDGRPRNRAEVRYRLNRAVRAVCGQRWLSPRVVHQELNRVMGVRSRPRASMAQLARGLRQAQAWLDQPGSLLGARNWAGTRGAA